MALRFVSSTFTTTGQSEVIKVSPSARVQRFAASLTFSSAGTVVLQRRVDGTNWRNVKTFTNASESTDLESHVDVSDGESYRLDCTAVSGTITYYLGAPRG